MRGIFVGTGFFGCRYYTGTPAFSFGRGLNPLTYFSLSPVAAPVAAGGGSVALACKVKNEGGRLADEVVMAFFAPAQGVVPPAQPAARLRRELFGFERVSLAPQESRVVTFHLTAQTLTLHDEDGSPTLFPGTYGIELSNGNGQRVHVDVKVEANGALSVPEDGAVVRASA